MALIVTHFPPSVASLYALPKAGANNILEWWSPLGGQPMLYARLDEQQQGLLLEKYAQRQQSLQLLIDELTKLGRSESAHTLHCLLGEPNLDNLYSINDDPVLVRWGPPPPPLPKVAPVVAPPQPLVAPRVTAKAAAQPRVTGRRGLWSRALLLLLLALLLAGLAYWLLKNAGNDNFSCQPKDTPPPEFVTVFDTSYSMVLNLDVTTEDEKWFFNKGKLIPGGNERTERLLAAPKRVTIAKQAIVNMVEDLHPAIDARLVTFAGCRIKTQDHGVFTKAQRPALLSLIRGMEVDDGTPLAASLEYAASKVDGRTKEAVVVMFIDGIDSCGADICAVAETIAREQPRLTVNVVNIGSEASASCITDATGGRTYASIDALKISTALANATEEVSGSAKCYGIF